MTLTDRTLKNKPGALKIVGSTTGLDEVSNMSMKLWLRGDYALPLADGRAVQAPPEGAEIEVAREIARLYRHMFAERTPEEAEFLGVVYADKPAEPSARDFLLEAERLTQRAQQLLRIDEAKPLSAGRAAK
jgi:hypothetical protein